MASHIRDERCPRPVTVSLVVSVSSWGQKILGNTLETSISVKQTAIKPSFVLPIISFADNPANICPFI